ncbi:no pollen germination related 1 [Actinidia rufa]|uniref:No pollen germination related 1 n=1 Tax=Actinidia rufa TaxID=165716 RepID=A0A7J0EK45_9ERIC|nr:no pollen germination related 1 [Actinidia rufa]
MEKVLHSEIEWDSEIMDHLTLLGLAFESLAEHVEQALPGIYTRAERCYFLSLCCSAAGQNEAALNVLKKVSGCSEAKSKPHLPSVLVGAKLCSQDLKHAREGIEFAHKVIDVGSHRNTHFIGQAHKFLVVCYGNAARTSLSDSERVWFLGESLNSLSRAALGKEDAELMFSFGLENAKQRNLSAAFDNVMSYSSMEAGSSGRGWKLLAPIVSAEQRFKDAETIVDLALDETERIDQFELLRLKTVLQIAQERPKHAIETYRMLLALIQAQREQTITGQKLRNESLARFGSDLYEARVMARCRSVLFEAQELYKKAVIAFTVALSIQPDFVPAIVATAAVLLKMNRQTLPIVRSFLMNALRLDPMNHEAWWILGLVSKVEGSIQQAADFFQAAHELKMSAPVQNF